MEEAPKEEEDAVDVRSEFKEQADELPRSGSALTATGSHSLPTCLTPLIEINQWTPKGV